VVAESAIDALLADAIAAGVCSAAAAAVGAPDRRELWARGTTATVPVAGAAIDLASPFDLASLTKPIATAMVTLTLVEDGRLGLDDAAARWLPALPPSIAVAHLLGHASGLPAHRKLYERIWAGELAGGDDGRAALVAMAAATAPEHPAGEAAVYSDLGFVALAALCERAGDAPFEALVAGALAPLGLAATRFADLRRGERVAGAVATELDARRGLVEGEVHDENAHAGGGIAGHAGLFAPIGDVARFAAAMATGPARGAGRISAARLHHAFTTAAAPGTSWRLGWDTPSAVPGVSHAGDAWPRAHAVGHLGFTGTSMWIDWAGGGYAVLLTNRVHPRRDRPEAAAIKTLRRRFGDLAWAWLSADRKA
jgi:CubicO group peptidase (beta-lactamase class C family)